MQKMIDKSIGGFEFKLEYIKKHNDLTNKIGKTEYLNQVVDVLSQIASPAERELYLKDVADSLGVEKDIVRDTVDMKITRLGDKNTKNDKNTTYSSSYAHNKHKTNAKKVGGLVGAEMVVIKGILHDQPYVESGNTEIIFSNKLFQKIYEQNLKLNEIDDKLDETELQEIAPLRIVNHSLTPQEQAIEWKQCFIELRIAYLIREREKVKDDMAKYQAITLQIKKLEKDKLEKQHLEEK